MNKKGNVLLILMFFFILFAIMAIGLGVVLLSSSMNYAGDTIYPFFEGLGNISVGEADVNLSSVSADTIGVANTLIQNLNWIVGFGYVLMLMFSIGFAVVMRGNPNPIFIGLYIILVLFLIIGSILISNTYQDLYQTNDDVGLRLQEHTLLSFMLLHSPIIMAIISLITGIYVFSGAKEEQWVS